MRNHHLAPVAAALGLALVTAPAAPATHSQPPLDISHLAWAPVGQFKPGDPVPPPDTGCDAVRKQAQGNVFNPSGRWVAFDNEVYEVLCLPYRQSADASDSDPLGNGGDPRHGYCKQPGDLSLRPGSWSAIAGVCPNHQLEYARYFADTMREILGDFGVTIRQYFFEVTQADVDNGGGNTLPGRAINTAAVVPGADHPDETVIVGAHFDQTNDGPASAWDSQEGHAEIIRMAKLMADYWRATGTRPSATVKFIPWDGEETGTLGSSDYVKNVVVPGEEDRVRGYWNTDPCAGGYPSFRYGNPVERINLGIQVGSPAMVGADYDSGRIEPFNERAPQLVENVLDHVDDKVSTIAGPVETFTSKQEGTSDLGTDIQIGTDSPLLFASDWRNFIRIGVPFFNPGPEVTGPNQDDNNRPTSLGNPDGIPILHTPNDNLQTMLRFTSPSNGLTFDDSWAKGMEFCSHLLSWGMLQHEQGGAQRTSGDVVAYFEALPNEAPRNAAVKFDASGSHQLASPESRAKLDEDLLEFRWDFGDRTPVAYGKVVEHRYRRVGTFKATLTVENVATGEHDSMKVPVVVETSDLPTGDDPPLGQPKQRPTGPGPQPPERQRPPAAVACAAGAGFVSAAVRPRGGGLAFEFQRTADHVVTAEVVQVARGRKLLRRPRPVHGSLVSEPFSWDGRVRGRPLPPGTYEASISAGSGPGRDVRRFAFRRARGRFTALRPVALAEGCGPVAAFALSAPTFDARTPLSVSFRLGAAARAAVTVLRGRRVVLRVPALAAARGRTYKLRIRARGRARGDYRIVLTAGREQRTLYATRL